MNINERTLGELALALRAERKRQKLSRDGAAAVCGVSASFIRDAESSPENCTLAKLAKLVNGLGLSLEVAGLEPKQLQADLKLDKAQFSRWTSGQEGVVWPKLAALMDRCGNDAPVLWMFHRRGYDLHSVRRRESELERELREAREENAALRRVLMGRAAA